MNLLSYDQLWTAIQQHQDTLVVTLNSEGTLDTTQVQCFVADDRQNIWFIVDQTLPMIDTLAVYPDVCLVWSDADDNEVASLYGLGTLVTDMNARHAAWLMMGKLDPRHFERFALVHVVMTYAECLDVTSNSTLRFTSDHLISRRIPSVRFNHFDSVEH